MNRRSRCAFSLVELLVVLGIIGILVGLLLPAVQEARGTAMRVSCLNNLKQIGLALHGFHDLHNRFPPDPVKDPSGHDPNAKLGWMALILPYMEQDSLYQTSLQACRSDAEALDNPPHTGLATVVRPYVCPADGRLLSPQTDRYQVRAAFTSYIGNGGGVDPRAHRGFAGVIGESPGSRLSQIVDGTSQTIMVGERPPPASFQAGWWYPNIWLAPVYRGPNNFLLVGAISTFPHDGCDVSRAFGPGRTDNPCDRTHFWSLHRGGASFLLADASARFLPLSAESRIHALLSRDSNEVVDLP